MERSGGQGGVNREGAYYLSFSEIGGLIRGMGLI